MGRYYYHPTSKRESWTCPKEVDGRMEGDRYLHGVEGSERAGTPRRARGVGAELGTVLLAELVE